MTAIQWADVTTNPIRVLRPDGSWGGHWCRKVSPGCANCYSEKQNSSGYFNFASKLPYRGKSPNLGLNREELEKWARMKKSKRLFVCSMTDWAGDWVPREWQFEMLDAMQAAPMQIFQLLSKCPGPAREAIADWCDRRGIDCLPKNIWVGTSVETQEYFDFRIDDLEQTQAEVKFLSCEPLLESVYFTGGLRSINWVIVGGESGPKSRPCDIQWVAEIVSQCKEQNVPVFVKQLGRRPMRDGKPIKLRDSKGGDFAEFLPELQFREFPKERFGSTQRD